MSLLIQIGGRINVVVNLDQEDVFMMGGVRFESGLAWQWGQDCGPIPCVVLRVDVRTGEHSRHMLPTYYQVSHLLDGFREVIFLFLLEDGSRADITGLGLGSVGMEALELRSAHLSFVV